MFTLVMLLRCVKSYLLLVSETIWQNLTRREEIDKQNNAPVT